MKCGAVQSALPAALSLLGAVAVNCHEQKLLFQGKISLIHLLLCHKSSFLTLEAFSVCVVGLWSGRCGCEWPEGRREKMSMMLHVLTSA